MEGEFISGVERKGEGEGEQWSLDELPRHIKKCIFANLPLQSISRSRLVCKEWNSILSSRSFLSSLPKNNPWLLLCTEKYCMAYCFSTQKWKTISLSFLPTLDRYIDPYEFSSAELGLLLVLKTRKFYYVCNPLIKVYAEIENDVNGRVIGIVQGGSSDELYLVARLGSYYDTHSFSIGIYHHFQNSWRIKFEFSEKTLFFILPFTMVWCNGVIFFKTNGLRIIVGYNIRDASIKPVRIAALPRILKNPNLGILLIGAYGLSVLVVVSYPEVHTDLGPLMGLVILELFEDDKDELLWKWREFAEMPPNSLPFYIRTGSDGYYEVVGDYLCFMRSNGKFLEGVAYNLKEGFWQCLPQCAYINYYKILSFQPTLMMKGWQ